MFINPHEAAIQNVKHLSDKLDFAKEITHTPITKQRKGDFKFGFSFEIFLSHWLTTKKESLLLEIPVV
jgi:hypothetical protein